MIPKVAIVGRPNVGKSSLLNMLAHHRVSIVEPTAGVTRDRVSHEIDLPSASGPGPRCEVVDTGGYGAYSDDTSLSALTRAIERQIATAIEEADLILFVVDAQAGLTPLDEQVAALLRARGREQVPVRLVANKVDDDVHEADAMEAAALGFGEPVCVSTTTGRNKRVLLEAVAAIVGRTAARPTERPSEMQLAIVGQRNAGKSTLVNTLAGCDRVITSELPGTTRDSIDVRFEVDGHAFTAIDTAGFRRRKSLSDDIDYYANHRALRAIRRADVVMHLIDATTEVTKIDKKLAHEIREHYKPCVIAINKWDLVEDRLAPEDYLDYLGQELAGIGHAPLAFISARTGQSVREAVVTTCELHEQATRRIGTSQLNRALQEILAERGPTGRLGSQAKIYYATMPATQPPTFVLFVNRPALFNSHYRRYLVNRLREHLDLPEVPIKLLLRDRRLAGRPADSAAG